MIRVADISDARELLEIYEPYIKNTAITFEYETPTLEEFQERIRNIKSRYPYLVLEEDGRILGYCYAGTFKGRASYDWSVETSIYILQGYHGQGYGRKLYEALEGELRKQNIQNLYACIAYAKEDSTHLDNSSMKFHEHMGYHLVGTFQNCAYKFHEWYHMIWMEKIIGEHNVPEKAVVWFPDRKEKTDFNNDI